MSEFNDGDREAKPVSISVGMIVETRSGGVVLVKQAKNDQWGIIAGHLKGENESLSEGAIREMHEEAGIELMEVGTIETYAVPYVYGEVKDHIGVVYKTKARISDEEINKRRPPDLAITEVRVFSQEEIIKMILSEPELIYKPEFNIANLIRWAIYKTHQKELIHSPSLGQQLH